MDANMQMTEEGDCIDAKADILDPQNEEGDDDIDNEEMGDTDEEEVAPERWIDVKDLKNMTLDELKALNTDKGDVDRRLDLPITKVVVRRLPPQITVEDYLQELSEMPSYNYIRLVLPNEDLPSRIGRRSSIYINFDTEQEAFWFKEKYNNMKFFDERGNSYIACVDFSFIQDVAQDPPDESLVGTLEESEMYKEFLKAYEEEPWSFTMNRPTNIPTPEAMLDEILNKKNIEPDSTPLLQFLREKSQKKEAARKEREQRRKERDIARRKQKEEIAKRRQKEKEEAAKRKQKDKDDGKRKPLEEVKDREKDNHRERRRERDRERQRERDKERRLRREKEKHEKEQQQGNKNSDDQNTTAEKSTQGNKDSKQKPDKDSKQKTVSSGNVTYSRSGNPTRWSENSGPRKGDKLLRDDHKKSQEQLNSTKKSSSSEKLPVEKSVCDNNQPGNSKTKDVSKPAFGKPFPSTSVAEESDTKTRKEDGSGDRSVKTNDEGSRKEANVDGVTKKRVIKRVIKVKKVKENGSTENGDDATNRQLSGSSDSKPKKIIRVVKKISKSSDDGNSTKSSTDAATKKTATDDNGEAKASTTALPKDDADKERKNRKGRPEIQIYRPGSLRGGASKSTTSSGDKERKSDNSNS